MGFLSKLLGAVSGNNNLKVSEQLLFDKVIGFRGIVPGCGVSTIVQNVAIALSEKTNFTICVLDTNFMYPVQYPMLVADESKTKNPDILDFSKDLSEITILTKYNNVYLVNLSNRTIVDMLSGKDTEYVINRVMGSLKSYFDVILVDISNEYTNIATHSAVRCNKIYQVADSSLKSLYNLKKSINTMVTLAVPLAKANKVILNKQLPDAILGVNGLMEEAGLQVIGEIPLSVEIAKLGAAGKKLYGTISKNKEITQFNAVIEDLVTDIAEKTAATEKYFNVKKVLEDMERSRIFVEKQGNEIVDTVEDSFDIVEVVNGEEAEISPTVDENIEEQISESEGQGGKE